MAKATVGKIEAEVRKAFGIKPKDGESYGDYQKRIQAAVDADKDEEKWGSLSEEAAQFLNTISVALKKGDDLPPFPADEDADEGEAEKPKSKKGDKKAAKKPAEDEDDEAEKPKAKKGDKKPAKADKKKSKPEKADKKKPAKKEKTEKPKKKKKGKSSTMRIKECVFGKPDISTADLVAKLKKEGFAVSDSTVASYRADFLHSLRYLKTEGVKGLPAGLD